MRLFVCIEEDYFGISSESGMLYSKNSLRGASAKSPYRLVVQAQDLGTPVLVSTAVVHINVSSGQLDNGKPIWISPRFGDSNVVTIMNITEVWLLRSMQKKAEGFHFWCEIPFEQIVNIMLRYTVYQVIIYMSCLFRQFYPKIV